MAEPEFTALSVRFGTRMRFTRAGQVRIGGGRVELLNSYIETDSAPGRRRVASTSWFAPDGKALADLNGMRYLLTLGVRDPASGRAAGGTAVHRGGTPGGRAQRPNDAASHRARTVAASCGRT